MLSDITFGQYFPGDSVLHRLDPRTKLVLLLLLLVAVFAFDSPPAYAVLSGFTLILMLLSRVPMPMMFRSLKPLWWLLAFTFVVHLFSHEGTEIFTVFSLTATVEGAERGFFICLRLVLLILLSALLTYTTSPLLLTDGIEDLFAPFGRIGVPAHELAMMMTIALRFVPTLIEETDRIQKAQQARGADFVTGSLLRRARNVVPILVPLFLSAFRHADNLALAMEARCYRGGVGRTRMKALRLSRLDYFAGALTLVLLAGLGVLCFVWGMEGK